MDFTSLLLKWYFDNRRELPWRGTRNPYQIWISEIILQQTRVAQAIGFYERFLSRFPDVQSLAYATEDQVLAAWQGLGYYSRARNLHQAAITIVDDYGGIFPKTYQQIRNLKGVGDYTAAAITSIAYDLPYAAVDGNVLRVLSRYFGLETPIDTTPAKKEITEIATTLLDQQKPGDFNQAIMDLGATICKPATPDCGNCPLLDNCRARLENKTDIIPRKKKKIKARNRYFHYFLILHKADNSEWYFWMQKRTGKDIWENMFQLPMVETTDENGLPDEQNHMENILAAEKTVGYSTNRLVNPASEIMEKSQKKLLNEFWKSGHHFPHHTTTHILSHQKITAFFYILKPEKYNWDTFAEDFTRVSFQDRDKYAFPVLITRFLKTIEDTLA